MDFVRARLDTKSLEFFLKLDISKVNINYYKIYI